MHKYVSVTHEQLNAFLDSHQAKAGKKTKTIIARAALLAAFNNIHELSLTGLPEDVLKQATLKKVIVPHCLKNIKSKDYDVFPIGDIKKAVTKEIFEQIETETPDTIMHDLENNPPHRNVLRTRFVSELPAEYDINEDNSQKSEDGFTIVHLYNGEPVNKVDDTEVYTTEEEALAVAREKVLQEKESIAVIPRAGRTVLTRVLTKPAKVTVAHSIVLSDELTAEEYLVLLPYKPFG